MHTIETLDARYDVIVVGGGVAAGACVTTLREGGYTGSIAVISGEHHAPYTRPGLSKHVLRGDKPSAAALWRPAEWYAEHDVHLVVGSAATHVDRTGNTLRVDGRSIGYDHLVLATGAEPRSIPVGSELRGRVHVLRSIGDADRARPHLGAGERWLVVGGGFIGAEFAASARMTGSDVTIVLPEAVVMERAFGAAVGGWFQRRLEARGVEVRTGSTVRQLVAAPDGADGPVEVQLADGHVLHVDHVLVGIGVVAATGLAAQSGLELALGGIAVDATLLTSDPRISAIGDVAAYESELHGTRVRIEHWDIARAHGVHVARRLAGEAPGGFRELPYFFSGMADWAFAEYVGIVTADAVLRHDVDADTLSGAYLDAEDRLVGLIAVGAAEDLDAARQLVPARARLDRRRVAAGEPLLECVLDADAASSATLP